MMEAAVVVVFALIILIVVFSGPAPDPDTDNSISTGRQDNFFDDELKRIFYSRRRYYNEVYLKSDAWKRKRYVVLRRDNWRCVRCGAPATQVHHKRYAPKRIGKEPIKWLESLCKTCHESVHQ